MQRQVDENANTAKMFLITRRPAVLNPNEIIHTLVYIQHCLIHCLGLGEVDFVGTMGKKLATF